MAKKKKKKPDIAQKRREKELKRKKNNKKYVKSNPSLSPDKNVEKHFTLMPTLLFEPEIFEIEYDQELIISTKEEKLPLQILNFFIPEILKEVTDALYAINTRTVDKPGSSTHIISKMALYLLESDDKLPVFCHPLLTAIYLYLQGKYIDGVSQVTNENIFSVVKSYQEEWKKFIENALENNQKDNIPNSYGIMLNKWEHHLQENFSEQENESFFDDIETFITDYLEINKKNITPTQWSIEYFENFLNNEFINMNPTEEDKISMKKSLKLFADYLTDNNYLDENLHNEINIILSQ